MADDHKFFSVSTTAYLANLSPEERAARCVAIHFERAPKTTETGLSLGMIFPVLIVSNYVDTPNEVAERVAAILNKHWDEGAA